MLERGKMERGVFEIVDTESLVPANHLLRKIDAKEKHGMRYTRYTGLAQVRNWVKLKFAAMNLKKFAKWSWRDSRNFPDTFIISFIFPKIAANPSLA